MDLVNHPIFECLFDKLFDDQSQLFMSVIAPFNQAGVDLVFEGYDNLPQSGGCSSSNAQAASGCTRTDEIDSDQITIYLKVQTATGLRNPLDIAGDILHEGVHAAIAAYINELDIAVNLINEDDIYDAYKLLSNNGAESDHDYMVDNYINPIAYALRSLDGNRLPLDQYLPIAWDGLRDYGKSKGLTDQQVYEPTATSTSARSTTTLCE